MDQIGPFSAGLLVLTVLIFSLALLVLALLMPLFVYQIRNDARRAVKELETLNTNLFRLLGSPRTPNAPPPPPADDPAASVEQKARFFGVSDR